MMWRGVLCIIGSAYGGPLLAMTILTASDATLRHEVTLSGLATVPVFFMIFTLPGSLVVTGVFDRLARRGLRQATAYAMTILIGTATGAVTLASIGFNAHFVTAGGFFGLTTSCCWAVLHRLLFGRLATTAAYARR